MQGPHGLGLDKPVELCPADPYELGANFVGANALLAYPVLDCGVGDLEDDGDLGRSVEVFLFWSGF